MQDAFLNNLKYFLAIAIQSFACHVNIQEGVSARTHL